MMLGAERKRFAFLPHRRNVPTTDQIVLITNKDEMLVGLKPDWRRSAVESVFPLPTAQMPFEFVPFAVFQLGEGFHSLAAEAGS